MKGRRAGKGAGTARARGPGGEPTGIEALPGLGPKSREMLLRAGISTVAQLRRLGSVVAYVKVKRSGANASLNLLWALESALTGEPWQDVARHHRTSLLLAVDECERRT